MIPKRDKLIIVTNGEKTEKLYFEHFKKKIEAKKNGDITLAIVPMGSKSDPLKIVNEAINQKNQSNQESLHSVWAVVEKDDFTDFQEAIILGKKNDIKVVYSNIAIEYWFYCHFKMKTKEFSVSDLSKLLTEELKVEYKKNVDITPKIFSKTKKAITNAKTSHQLHKKDGKLEENSCSSTNIYVLMENLLKRIE